MSRSDRGRRARLQVESPEPGPRLVVHDDQEGIRQYTRHRAFYLPASERNEGDSEEDVYLQQESYIDLRRITSIRRGTLDEQRRAAMNEEQAI